MTQSLFRMTLALGLIAGLLTPMPIASADTVVTGTTAIAATTHVDTYRNNTGHNGYTSDTLPTPLSLFWKHTTTFVKGNPASPACADSTLFFGAGSHVYALNASNGALKWKYPATGQTSGNFETTPALDNGALFIGNDDSQLYKLDTATGKVIWTKKTQGPVRSSPVVSDGIVYFGSSDNYCYALDAKTGNRIWAYASEGPVSSAPTVAGTQIVFASADNSVYSLNIASGKKSWSLRFPSDPGASPPVYGDSTVYVGAGTDLYALTPRAGTVKWTVRLSSEISTPATLGQGTIYVATQDSMVYAYSERGRKLWGTKVAYTSYAAPILAGNILLIPGQHGVVYALDAKTGKLKWQYVIQAVATDSQPKYSFTDITSAPIFADNTLYILSDDGSLSAFRADAADSVAPQVDALVPAAGATVAGVGLSPQARLIDDGSGIDPGSIVLSLDGTKIPNIIYDPSKNSILINPDADNTVPVPTLAEGAHHLQLIAKDWRGNVLTKTWGFVVDNRFNPAGTQSPPETPAPATDNSSGDTGGNPGGSSGANTPPPPPPAF